MKKLISILFAAALFAAAGRARALTPQFNYVPTEYIAVPGPDGHVPVNLTPFLAAQGFQETGFGYAYVAGGTPYWDHFNPLGDDYETFAGAYRLFSFKYAGDWKNPDGSAKTMHKADVVNSANRFIALGIADQNAWLFFYSGQFGGPTASTYVPGSLFIAPVADPQGFWLITFRVTTESDLGAPTQPAPFVPPYSTYAGDVPAWEPVTVLASARVKYDVPSGEFVASYSSEALYQVDGHPAATPPWTTAQLALMEALTTFQ